MPISTYDIESIGWVNPVAIGFHNGKQQDYNQWFKESKESDQDIAWDFLQCLADSGVREIFAHRAADYDNKFIIGSLAKHGQTVAFQGGLNKLEWVETGIVFVDSYTMLPRSLASLCKAFDVPHKKRLWNHNKTYLIWKDPKKLQRFLEYLRIDCLSLAECIDAWYRELQTHFKIRPASTMALTAVKAFDKSFYKVSHISSNEHVEGHLREATYGGRCEVYRRYGEGVVLYDIRDAYPSCYDTEVPVGRLEPIPVNLDEGTVAYAKVRIPKSLWIGPLPVKRNGSLVFPVGEVEGWWDTRELKFAHELGCDMEVQQQYGAEEVPILKEFGETVCGLRDQGNEDWGKIWKMMAVRLSGKFGEGRTRAEFRHVSQIDDLIGWTVVDLDETYFESQILRNGSRAPFVRPAINMRVRAEARIRHLRYLLRVGPEHAFYCDTDSIYATQALPIGDRPGDLRIADFAVRAYFIRPKFYGYVDSNLKVQQRTAGWRDHPLDEQAFTDLCGGKKKSCTYQAMSTLREIFRSGAVRLVDRHRTVRGDTMDNRLLNDDGITTRPILYPTTSS